MSRALTATIGYAIAANDYHPGEPVEALFLRALCLLSRKEYRIRQSRPKEVGNSLVEYTLTTRHDLDLLNPDACKEIIYRLRPD